jgi:hypothetical protein
MQLSIMIFTYVKLWMILPLYIIFCSYCLECEKYVLLRKLFYALSPFLVRIHSVFDSTPHLNPHPVIINSWFMTFKVPVYKSNSRRFYIRRNYKITACLLFQWKKGNNHVRYTRAILKFFKGVGKHFAPTCKNEGCTADRKVPCIYTSHLASRKISPRFSPFPADIIASV